MPVAGSENFGIFLPMQNSSQRYFSNPKDYRYSYNGMEKDDEVSGNGNSYTTQFRQYDPRLGRWKSLDPMMAEFPSTSAYVAFDNNPIYYVDPYGLSPSNNGGGGSDDRGEKRKRKKDKKTDDPVVYTDVEEVDYTYEQGVLV